ncbi:MAG TPA: alpha/beta hydrolase [Rhodanobacteraceae bacterium]
MKLWAIVLGLLAVCGSANAATAVWQPSAGHVQIPIWPGTAPGAQPLPGPEYTRTGTKLLGGKTITGVYNVSRPTMTVYAPKGRNTGAAVVVFPGGGFAGLAIDLEGTDVCDWLTPKGITYVLLKYRVPSIPYDWHCDCRPHNFDLSVPSLQDAQRTIGLVRLHAQEWHIDPHKVGVIGFSAGGFLVAEVSTQYGHRLYKPVDAADKLSARPDFAMAIYPGHLTRDGHTFNRNLPVTRDTPPTFLVQAEDDNVDGVDQALVYFTALKQAGVPAELHIYAHGGHAFGLRHTSDPITDWPKLAEVWMRAIGVVPN